MSTGQRRCVFTQEFPDFGVAFSAISAHAEALYQLLAGAGALADGLADLAVGYRFADADVH
jgi:X-X-X-Leu-X-X-Gly heptad repeat protein